MSETIFNESGAATNPASNNPNPAPQVNDDISTRLSQITNEQGVQKYKDLSTALDALKHSQEFIPQLKTDFEKVASENAKLKAELERLKTIEESLEQISNKNPVNQPVTQAITEESIQDLVTKALEQREVMSSRKANISQVVNKVKELYGEKSEEAFYGKAKELGLNPAQINKLAEESPQVVFKLLGIDSQPSNNNAFNKSSVNTAALPANRDSVIGKNTKSIMVGATYHDFVAESASAKKMVEDLSKEGLSVADLTDPKKYFQYINSGN